MTDLHPSECCTGADELLTIEDIFGEESQPVRKNNKVFWCDDIPVNHEGFLPARLNPDSGVHYVWYTPEPAMEPFTEEIHLAVDDCYPPYQRDGIVWGWWEDGKPVFRELVNGETVELESIPYSRESLFSRNGNLVCGNALADKLVIIAGVGSVGSVIAQHLARAGVTHFILCDSDCVELHNLSRTFDRSMLGAFKTKAVAGSLKLINPQVEVTTYQCQVQQVDASFYQLIRPGNTLIIGCGDNRISDEYLCRLASDVGADFLSAGFWNNAAVSENFVYRHGTQDHLYGCLLKESIEIDARIQHNNNYTTNDGKERKVNAGLGVNVQLGNAVSALLALDLLMRKEEDYQPQVLPTLTTQMLLFVGTNNPALAGDEVAQWAHRPLWAQCCPLTPDAACHCHSQEQTTL